MNPASVHDGFKCRRARGHIPDLDPTFTPVPRSDSRAVSADRSKAESVGGPDGRPDRLAPVYIEHLEGVRADPNQHPKSLRVISYGSHLGFASASASASASAYASAFILEDLPECLACSRVPKPDRAVNASRHQPRAIRAERCQTPYQPPPLVLHRLADRFQRE